jgi:hypothetical protein
MGTAGSAAPAKHPGLSNICVESVPQQSADLNQMLTGADMLRVTLHWNVPECDVSTLYDTSRGLYLGHTVKFIHSFTQTTMTGYGIPFDRVEFDGTPTYDFAKLLRTPSGVGAYRQAYSLHVACLQPSRFAC